MKYCPRRDIPDFARQLKTLSPSAICKMILNKRNVERTPESILMWFKDHPDVKAKLEKEVVEALPTEKQAVDDSIYQNGNFRNLPSVQNWIKELTNRNAKEDTIKNWVSALKAVCIGELRAKKKNTEQILIEDWALKHPDRLSVQDAKDFVFEMKKRGLKSRRHRLALRNFFDSCEKTVKSGDISGDLEEDAGQYADMYVSRDKLYEVLEWLRQRSEQAYLACKFAFKTASRLTATLGADAQYLNTDEHTLTVFEKSVNHKDKKRVFKVIPSDLWDEVPKQGKLFNIAENELNALLREAYKEIIPEMADRIPMPFHFWRHMFAQHLLRLTNWNYGLVGELGNWNPDTLKKYYGKIPHDTVVQVGLETLPKL